MIAEHIDLTMVYEEIKIRLLSLDDCQPYYVNWLNDPRVCAFLETRHALQTLESITEYVKNVSLDDLNHHFAIVLVSNNKHIGNIKLGPINTIHKTADISYFIGDVTCWGHGYAYQAIKALSRVAFNTLGLMRLQASCYEANIGSIKVLKKSGFSQEGVLRNKFIDVNGARVSSCVFGLLEEEFNE